MSAEPEPRKCHNCRFYRDAEVAQSGWCIHPERQAIQDLVLVRKWELACRDLNDDDLWEAAVPYLALQVVHEYVNGIH